MIKRLASVAAAFLGLAGYTAASAEEQGPQIHVKHLDNRAVIAFAKSFYSREIGYEDGIKPLFPQSILYALVNLKDRPGPSELILVINHIWWCGTAGCRADIFRKTRSGYELICGGTDFPDTGGKGATILPETDFGYHRINTYTSILHWDYKQKFNSGTLCFDEDLYPS